MNQFKKIKFLYDGLSQQTKWYTGISIKRYLKKNVFSLQEGFFNRVIDSGRWSAYCHFNQLTSFENLISKYVINENSVIIVHPLTPSVLVNHLAKTKAELITVDINKATLAFEHEKLEDLIRQLRIKNKTPDLIIHFNNNGLYDDVTKNLNFASELYIPSVVVLDSYQINSEFITCLQNITLGSILWLSEDSFIDEHLHEVIGDAVRNLDWYFSIHFEDRVRSTAENHLRESHDIFREIIQEYMILLSNQEALSGIKIFALWQLIKVSYIKKDEKVEQIRKNLLINYGKLESLALPDFIFDLEYSFPLVTRKSRELLEEIDLERREKAKRLYDFFAQYIAVHNNSELEIPVFYLDRNYLNFILFTTNKAYWLDYFTQKHITISVLISDYNSLVSKEAAPNAFFAINYGLKIDLSTLYNSVEL